MMSTGPPAAPEPSGAAPVDHQRDDLAEQPFLGAAAIPSHVPTRCRYGYRLTGAAQRGLRPFAGDDGRKPVMANPPPTMTPPIDDALLDHVRAHIATHHWLVVHAPQDAMTYTLGLTAYDLPELVVCPVGDPLTIQVDRWAARCVSGELELAAIVTVADLNLREHAFATRGYDVANRGGLDLARALYGSRLAAREIDVRSCRCVPCRSGLYHRGSAG